MTGAGLHCGFPTRAGTHRTAFLSLAPRHVFPFWRAEGADFSTSSSCRAGVPWVWPSAGPLRDPSASARLASPYGTATAARRTTVPPMAPRHVAPPIQPTPGSLAESSQRAEGADFFQKLILPCRSALDHDWHQTAFPCLSMYPSSTPARLGIANLDLLAPRHTTTVNLTGRDRPFRSCRGGHFSSHRLLAPRHLIISTGGSGSESEPPPGAEGPIFSTSSLRRSGMSRLIRARFSRRLPLTCPHVSRARREPLFFQICEVRRSRRHPPSPDPAGRFFPRDFFPENRS